MSALNHPLENDAAADAEWKRLSTTKPSNDNVTASPKAATVPPPWRKKLVLNEKGNALANVDNAMTVLRLEPKFKGRIRLDELKQAVVCQDLPWSTGKGWQRWADTDTTRLAAWFQRTLHLPMSIDNAHRAAVVIAQENRFNPVTDYLDSLKWDGTERLDSFLEKYFGASKDAAEYLRVVGPKWMIAAVARAYEPGCKVDHMLIFEGAQGPGKSKALRALTGDDWFTDTLSDMGSKDAAQDLHGKWIIEVSELSAMSHALVEKVKGFVSRQVDHYRPSYGRMSVDFPRRCVFVGTTNEETYLKDQTGNRRYWPVKMRQADDKAIARDRDQLWAEAVVRYKKGEQWWLTPEQEKTASNVQDQRRHVDPWEEPARKYAKGRQDSGQYIVINDFLTYVEIETERQTKALAMRAGNVFRAIGLEKSRSRVPASHSETRPYYYIPKQD
jgi:predicted P-loop ATPase